MPFGLTTPMPVMTTRFFMRLAVRCQGTESICITVANGLSFEQRSCSLPNVIIDESTSDTDRTTRQQIVANHVSLGNLHLGPVLPHQVQLLQLCFRRIFAGGLRSQYVEQVCAEIAAAERDRDRTRRSTRTRVDSIYLGGGTPSVLAPDQLARLFQAVRENFDVDARAEITVECAPGTITDRCWKRWSSCGVNRVSLGVQSFVDQECSSVGRLHTRAVTLDDIARLRAAGIGNIGIDLIAGLPHQTEESWEFSLSETLATGVPHVSVYMLEVDEDSRLGKRVARGRQPLPCALRARRRSHRRSLSRGL